MSVTAEKKQEIIKDNAVAQGDTGSPEVQVAILTERIAVRRMLERPGGGGAAANTELVSREALANGIRQIVNQMAERATEQGIPVKNVHLRFMSVLQGGYSEIGLPVPSLKGGQHEKDLRPAKGDWIVYRALLLLSRVRDDDLRRRRRRLAATHLSGDTRHTGGTPSPRRAHNSEKGGGATDSSCQHSL